MSPDLLYEDTLRRQYVSFILIFHFCHVLEFRMKSNKRRQRRRAWLFRRPWR